MSYQQDRIWSDTYLDEIQKLIWPYLKNMMYLKVAPPEIDNIQAGDMLVECRVGTIAIRLRRSSYAFRDLTIRAKRDSGSETELSKIKKGLARWYFYGWLEGNAIGDFIFIDLDKVRASGLLNNRPLIDNGDGTYFIAIPAKELKGCMVACRRGGIGWP